MVWNESTPRSAAFDDVVANTLGAMIGGLAMWLVRRAGA